MDELQRKLRKLLHLGLHPSTGANEAAQAFDRAKHIARQHDVDLTRFFEFGGPDMALPKASAPARHVAPDPSVVEYLSTTTQILDRATELSQQLSHLQRRATDDPRFFYHSEWQADVQRVIENMNTVPTDFQCVLAPESVVDIHVVYMRIAVAYRIRAIHMTKAIECLRRLDLDGASSCFGDVARVGELLTELGRELGTALAKKA